MQRLMKTLLDKIIALLALIVFSPIMLVATIGIICSSRGPVLYSTKRMGKNMKPFTIYKFRTMYVGADKEGAITRNHDTRIFAWGEILRKTKIDELPQLINVLDGTMSIIGPRPENIEIVEEYYTNEEKATLNVLPGLACPGSIFNYTHGEQYLSDNDTDETYVKSFLHIKMALDLYYLEHWSLFYDIEILFRTMYVIVNLLICKKRLPYPKEYNEVFGRKNKDASAETIE